MVRLFLYLLAAMVVAHPVDDSSSGLYFRDQNGGRFEFDPLPCERPPSLSYNQVLPSPTNVQLNLSNEKS